MLPKSWRLAAGKSPRLLVCGRGPLYIARPTGIRIATLENVLHIQAIGPRTPILPRRWAAWLQLAASAGAHLMAAAALMLLARPVAGPLVRASQPERIAEKPIEVQHIVFLARDPRLPGGGGGGGGNQQPGPIRRAQGIGSDAITLRVRKPAPLVSTPETRTAIEMPSLPAVVLDAKPLASGTFDQTGLPSGGVMSGTSTGPGSGGGVGTGVGTGIGSGRGPGVGPGSGGGIGGGVYRPGGAVSAPRALVQVTPKYSIDALRDRIEGTVVLELVVTCEGLPSQIRVVRSLDAGLDQQAIEAAEQWRFAPGRLGGAPVDVLVTLMLDFHIR